MPKIKTHKSLTKRIEVTGSGKLRIRNMSVAHRARFKSKRALGASDAKRVLTTGIAKKLRKAI